MDERHSGPDAGRDARALARARHVARIRRNARRMAALQAQQLRLVAELDEACTAEAREQLAHTEPVPGAPSEIQLAESLVSGELMAVLGIGEFAAQRLRTLAARLVTVLPSTLGALESGRLDVRRASVLSEQTAVMDDAGARAVEALVLSTAGASPWDGPSPRTWRARIDRAVVKVDPGAAHRRRTAGVGDRAVRSWPNGDGTGSVQATAADVDIVLVDRVITDLALEWPAMGLDGLPLTMDQRRADVFIDLFRRVAAGEDLPVVRSSRAGEVGVVLHADTLFRSGPASDDPGELRGFGAPAPVDPQTAAAMAARMLADGAATRVLLVDDRGTLQRSVRLRATPPGGWTRDTLSAAVHTRLADLRRLSTESYEPTAAIEDHVRLRNTRCTAFDCPRASKRCDIDHDTPWPRGPTDVDNLAPRCRRHHELKTRRLLRTRLHPDGSVTTRSVLGSTVTTYADALPGHGLGEAYPRWGQEQ